MHALGHSPDFGSFLLPDGQRDANSDLAFWGDLVFHGDYDGFRILRDSPGNPKLISRTRCNGDQGDIVVWGDVLVRAWNAPKTTSRDCDGTTVPAGFEGMHIFDISDLTTPVQVGAVRTDCGSHTHTLLPEPENDRAILYVSSYPLGGAAIGPDCQPEEGGGDGHRQVSIVEVPLSDPAAATVSEYQLEGGTATYLNAFTFSACHDISVFKELDLAAAACLGPARLAGPTSPSTR